MTIDPDEFQRICAAELRKGGWKTELTSGSGGQHVDIMATKGQTVAVFSCKSRQHGPLGEALVRQVSDGIGLYGADIAVVVTNSTHAKGSRTQAFSDAAEALASDVGVQLLVTEQLSTLEPLAQMSTSYFTLGPSAVEITAGTLRLRVSERFPGSGLSGVAAELEKTANETRERLLSLKKPLWSLRLVSYSMLAATAGLVLYLEFGGIDWSEFSEPFTFRSLAGLLDAVLGTAAFITAFVVFVWSIEQRQKRRKVLEALNELRSFAHVIDMHQLTKDPERAKATGPDTPASPKRALSLFELGRYLDYCSEMLAVVSKVAALYAQAFSHETVLATVDQIETLANGLSRKIWQKLMLLQSGS